MKTGTMWCWLFGHKFIHKTKDVISLDFLRNRVETNWQLVSNCIRCGISKD